MSLSGTDRRRLLALIQSSAEVVIEEAAAAGNPIVCYEPSSTAEKATSDQPEKETLDSEQTPPQKTTKPAATSGTALETPMQASRGHTDLMITQQPTAVDPVPKRSSAWSAADDDAARAALSALMKPRRTTSLGRMRARTSDEHLEGPSKSASFLRRSIFGRSKSSAAVPSVQVRAPQEWL